MLYVMNNVTEILLTFLVTSLGWFSWYQWHRPRLVSKVSEYMIARCYEVFQQAILTDTTPRLPELKSNAN